MCVQSLTLNILFGQWKSDFKEWGKEHDVCHH